MGIHTNICNSTATNFIIHIPPYRYVPLNLITDHDLCILPKSELCSRLPLADWTRISPDLLQFGTSELRRKLHSSLLHRNFAPFYPPEIQITNPYMKGCTQFFNALSSHSFDTNCWTKFTQFSTDYALSPEILEKQIIKLSNTSRAIEAKDLQYKVLRNTCITNNKLHNMKILDSPKCTLCNNPSKNSTHWFYHCPQALLAWQLLTNITSHSLYPHDFTITTAILNIPHLPKNHHLIVLTNLTRQIIDRAHTNRTNIHPNTPLQKSLTKLTFLLTLNYRMKHPEMQTVTHLNILR